MDRLQPVRMSLTALLCWLVLTWLAVFYAAMLPAEYAWLLRALRRHSRRHSAG